MMKRLNSGMVLMLGSATAFSLMAVSVKLGAKNIPPQELIAIRSLFIILLVVPILLKHRVPLLGSNRRLLLLRGTLGYIAMSCYFYTLTLLPVADAMVLQYMSPIFTILWAALFLSEKPNGRIVPAALACILGLLLVVKPQGEGTIAIGVIGLIGAALAGGAYATVRALRTTDNPYTIVFYFPLVSLPPSLVLSFDSWVWPSTNSGWMAVAGVCIFSYFGQILLTRGLRAEQAPKAILMNYLSVGFGLLFGVLFFSTWPDFYSILGAGLILFGISLVAFKRSAGST